MAEHISLSSDGRWLVFAGNSGADSLDIDRRHIVRVPVDRAAPEVLTPGSGLEWSPAITGDGATLVFISATSQRPPLPAVMPFRPRTATRTIGADQIPRDFPTGLVTPRQVVFRSADGLTIHGQLFDHRRERQPQTRGRLCAAVHRGRCRWAGTIGLYPTRMPSISTWRAAGSSCR
jgi:hypothetical protein